MTTLIPDSEGYYEMTLSVLRVKTVPNERLYITEPQGHSFYYNADSYDSAFRIVQAQNAKMLMFSELGFPAIHPDIPCFSKETLERMSVIDRDRIGVTFKQNSIRMVANATDNTVSIKALVKPYIAFDVVEDGLFVFGLRGTSISHYREYFSGGSTEVRHLNRIFTWDLIAVDFSKVKSSGQDNDLHKLTMMSEVIPPAMEASPEAKEIFNNIMDFTNPEWPTGTDALIKKGRARNWKEFVGEETRELWSSFNTNQRNALCKTFTSIAEWANAEECPT
jgi:hypothetical protein